jgi:hypothetical protein
MPKKDHAKETTHDKWAKDANEDAMRSLSEHCATHNLIQLRRRFA